MFNLLPRTMKIQYGITGFAIGIMSGLLIGIAEMKMLKYFEQQIILPFVIGLTVLTCAVAGIFIGIRLSKRS
jgi:hypothetical protein